MLLRRVLLHIAERPWFRDFFTHSQAARSMARRFVAGETMPEALEACARIQKEGFTASLDHLGESVSDTREAEAARDAYLQLLDQIAVGGLSANVSVKLTQMGLDVSQRLCVENVRQVAERAAGHGNFVRIDMEASAYTQRTLDIVRCLHNRYPNVGTVIQSYLYRSEQDVRDLLAQGVRIRLCKGAYQEPADVAFPHKADVDANYVKLTKVLLKSGIYHGIATHDARIINETVAFVKSERINRDAFEFQMLYGIRRDLQARLRDAGYRVRLYIPYGSEWFPYLTRRLAERPANIGFLVRNLLRG